VKEKQWLKKITALKISTPAKRKTVVKENEPEI
jgi:hypothetical protein